MAVEQLAVSLFMNAQQYKREAQQAAQSTSQISRSASTAGTATGKLDSQMSGLAKTAKFAVAGIATAAVVGFGKESVQSFLGFDDAMNQSLAIMGDVSETMRGEMADAAREIGKTSRIGAEEAAEAYFFLASAGLDAEQSIAALPQVAKFAQAGMFSMSRATDLATDAQSALGLTVDDAAQNLENLTRVTDVFTKANILANTSVEQVAEAMTNKAGAAMRAVGIDIEEGTAVLAAFADQGVKGAEAGTQFSIVLRDLQTKALENKGAFEAAGIAVFDSSGEFRNFAAVIGDLENRLDGMSDAQKKAELATLGFSDKSIAALTTLLGTSDAIREYERELRIAAGTTEEIANKQMESFQGQLTLLKGKVTDLQISIGEGLVPVLVDMGNELGPLIDLLGGFIGGVSDVRREISKLADDPSSPFQFLGVLSESSMMGGLVAFTHQWDNLMGILGFSAEEAALKTAKFGTDQQLLNNELIDSADKVLLLSNRYRETGTSLEGLTEAEEEAAEIGELHAEVLDMVAQRASVAAAAIRRQARALSNIHNPIFRAVELIEDLADAEKGVLEAESRFGRGSTEFRDATIARARIISDLTDTLLELQEEGIDPTGAAAEAMLRNMGIPDEVIAEIFADIDAIKAKIEGTNPLLTVDMFVNGLDELQSGKELQPFSRARPGIPDLSGLIGPDPVISTFHSGGIVPGLRGSDQLIIAAGGETILPTHRLPTSGGGTTVQNITLQSTGDTARDAQVVSLMLANRSLVRGGLRGGAF